MSENSVNRSAAEKAQIQSQVEYFAARRPVRMEAVETPYVHRHFAEAAALAGLCDGEQVCEWGAGMGRFSALFARQGCQLTAIELSPALADVCRQTLAGVPHARLLEGDIREVAEGLEPTFDLIAGFFMLHHLPAVEPYFQVARRLLKPGGRFVFVEPNPRNPLYAVQITLTPGMRWREEGGVYRMWPGAVQKAAERAGFSDFAVHCHGALPRGPYNLMARFGMERMPEIITPRPLRPFQVFTARKPDESDEHE